jgi:hypothetical protein
MSEPSIVVLPVPGSGPRPDQETAESKSASTYQIYPRRMLILYLFL